MGRILGYLLGVCVAVGCAAAFDHHPAQPVDATAVTATVTPATSTQSALPADFREVRGHAGFWRIGRDRNGVWWFLSPQNQPEFLNGVTTVQPTLRSYNTLGTSYVSLDWDEQTDLASLSDWAQKTARHVMASGFKSLGAWCSTAMHQCKIPMTRDLNVSRWAWGDEPLGTRWRQDAERAICDQVVPLRDNHDLIGYYIDNELDWDAMPSAAEPYFRLTTALIHKYDPNHLILGCRYRGWVSAEVARAARDYTDAQSLNYYASDGLLDPQVFSNIAGPSQQPLVISEYSFHSLDGRSGNANHSHFPGQVRSQAARAAGYRLMTQRLAQVPYVIGADWFQWMDEPAAGRTGDGEDANVGIVDIHDQPYRQLVEAVKETTPLLNPLHSQSAAARNQLVWRTPMQGRHAPTAFAGTQQELLSN